MVPICYYPTTVIMIDDNADYLNNISLHLPHKNSCFKFHTNPMSGLKSIQESLKLPSISSRTYEYTKNRSYNQIIDQGTFVNEIYYDDRFKEISIIVVDYSMPKMNGLELLSELPNKNILKILLTGDADEAIAIRAFNDNIIDFYIKKQNPSAEKILSQKILETQKKYFVNFSRQLMENRLNDNDFLLTTNNLHFEEYFFNLILELNIVEYYQFEKSGSYLLVDANGTPYSLFTQNEDQIEASYVKLDGLIDAQKMTAIKNRSKMICFPIAPKTIIETPENWSQYLNPIQKTFNNQNKTFHCSIMAAECGLNIDNILPFNLYLESQNANTH